MNITFDAFADCDTPGHFFHRKAKKYAIDQMLTPSQKQCTQKHILLTAKKTQQKKSLYFQNMIKEQNKKMFINTFIKKLKRTIVRQNPVEHQSLNLHQKNQKYVNGLHISAQFQLFFSVFSILQISFLITIVSLSLVFKSVYSSNLYILTLVISFCFHIIDAIKSIISVKNQDGKRFQKMDELVWIYIQSQGIRDFILLVAFIIQFCFYNTFITELTRYLFILKIIPLLKRIDFFQHAIIQNVYWEQVWELVKLFLINYIFAHFLSLILVSMARIDNQQNWMNSRNIDVKSQGAQYIWAYYWATTIMLTVGFGDIAPVNDYQALLMIFIEMISCILLAYNINNVGIIISKIRSYSVIQRANLKTFRNLTSSNSIPLELSNRISNYIKESVEMKRKSNIDEQNHFVKNLPNSFREDLLKQCNKKIWSQLLFFKNLSDKTILQLSIKIQKKLAHPQQYIHRYKDPLNVIIFNAGQIAYTYYRSSNKALYSNGKIVQKYSIKPDQFKLLTLDFLFNSFFPFNVKCVDYTIMYTMNKSQLIGILKDNPYDYEYFCMMKDKDKLLLNEFQIYKCQLCQKQKHYLDKCPKLHYIPLKQHIVQKFLCHNLSQQLMVRLKNPRISKPFYKTFTDKKMIREDLLRKRVEQRDMLNRAALINKSMILIEEKPDYNIESDNLVRNSTQQITEQEISAFNFTQQQSYYMQAAEKLKDEMSKVINLQQNKEMMWDIEIDSIQDFKYYFKKFNPQKINVSLRRKQKRRRRKAKGGSLRGIF